MSRVNFIEYKGKKILFIDNIRATKEEALQNFFDFDKIIKKQPLKSVVVLHDLTEVNSSSESLEKWKTASTEHEKYVTKNAMVGAKGIKLGMIMAYKIYTRLMGIDADKILKTFSTQEEAKEWLIKD